jgi:hypothetical protein
MDDHRPQPLGDQLPDFVATRTFAQNVWARDLSAAIVQRGVFVCRLVPAAQRERVDGPHVDKLAIMLQASFCNDPSAVPIDPHRLIAACPTDVQQGGRVNDSIAPLDRRIDDINVTKIATNKFGVDSTKYLGIRLAADEGKGVVSPRLQLSQQVVAEQSSAASNKNTHG